jgi:hypothetical protein
MGIGSMLKRCFVFVIAAMATWVSVTQSSANSLRSIDIPANQYERGILTSFPTGFGSAEFTFEIWVKLDNRTGYPTGLRGAYGNPRLNWCSENASRYVYNCWWRNGNFLIDGVNVDGVTKGTFALQMYDGGARNVPDIGCARGDRINMAEDWLIDADLLLPGGGVFAYGLYLQVNNTSRFVNFANGVPNGLADRLICVQTRRTPLTTRRIASTCARLWARWRGTIRARLGGEPFAVFT